jgi:hypothetical protein
VEIECYTPFQLQDVARKLALHGCSNYVSVNTDGSLHWRQRPRTSRFKPISASTMHGVEVRVLLEQHRYGPSLWNVCASLAEMGARINAKAGLHVHLDCRNSVRNRESVFARLSAAEEFLFSCVSPSRRKNEYCQRKDLSCGCGDPNCSDRQLSWDHHSAINCSEYYDTIEVRMHQGTVEYEKIANWIELLVNIADRPDASAIANIRDLRKLTAVDASVANFYTQRIKEFTPKQRPSPRASKRSNNELSNQI